ncbi:class I poly(R)-hydroxyalkanoic acid synthase [Methylocella silvestris]|uniref:class I poly(R)-hydroxyalkanoic acid synthase n=1 Tax=Methylocella silvestris TaxID=199596 RepID=UPI0015E07BCC|nr:class I poly(R)-hydroxyalkanoic acid synthase [Methylocella silvestris]
MDDKASKFEIVRPSALQTSAAAPASASEVAFPAGGAVIAEMMQDAARIGAAIATRPWSFIQMQVDAWTDQLDLLEYVLRRASGQPAEPIAKPAHDDRRFKDVEWSKAPLYDAIKQNYLLAVSRANRALEGVHGLDDELRQRADFYLRQICDALAPTNFAITNPEVMRATLSGGGANLFRGAQRLADDIVRGGGRLNPELSDRSAFDVGRNLATTPGKVIYENDLMQLIQYDAATEQVRRVPVLIVPSWINKFYVLDLSERNSFVRWLVGEGHTVFIISWINPDSRHADKTFGDYMALGPLAALEEITRVTGEPSVNAVGYCIGGTLLATTLVVMASRGDKRIASATYFATLVDFTDPGDMAVFTSEAHLATLAKEMAANGYLDARVMADTFNLLKANDLIWSTTIKSYLLGKDPVPFDLLFWNSDATRMPGGVHTFFLRNMYRDNRLVVAGGIAVNGAPVDMRKVDTPCFILSTREDHIAPWRSTYAATRLFRGDTTFVLAGSGHVAGVINPPVSNKYSYWTNDALPEDAEEWLAGATENVGSWWSHWQEWLARHSGDRMPARRTAGQTPTRIEDAPGRYVKVT